MEAFFALLPPIELPRWFIGTPAPPLCRGRGLALRNRLVALLAKNRCAPGRFLSDIRAVRVSTTGDSSPQDDQGISNHYFGRVCIVFRQQMRSGFVGKLHSVLAVAPTIKESAHRVRCRQVPMTVLCQTVFIVVHSV